MLREVIWKSGAESDLQNLFAGLLDLLGGDENAVSQLLERPLEDSLEVICRFPEIAPRVDSHTNLRRSIFGRARRYGLFYSAETKRVIIHAVVDLRQDPEIISRKLKGRL